MPTRQYIGKIEEVLVNAGRFSVFRVSHLTLAGKGVKKAPLSNSSTEKPSIATCTVSSAAPNEAWVLLTGSWRKHPTYGWQFNADRVSPAMPQDAESIRDYLRSGEVDLIGEGLADRLVDRFGDKTLHIMETSPTKLTIVRGIGEQRAESIAEHVKAKRLSQTIVADLVGLGVPESLVPDLHKTYGDYALSRIKQNPYEILAGRPIYRFDVADDIARFIGFDNHEEALVALVTCAIAELNKKGNQPFIPLDDLYSHIGSQYPAYAGKLGALLENLPHHLKIQVDNLGSLYVTQKAALKHLRQIRGRATKDLPASSKFVQCVDAGRFHGAPGALAYIPSTFDARQVAVINGSLGTRRKTFVSQLLCQLRDITPNFTASLFCLSAHAAENLGNFFDEPVSIIGPLLRSGRKKTKQIGAGADLVIVFESEKLDLGEVASLTSAVSEATPLILVGDRLAQSALMETIFNQMVSLAADQEALIDLDSPDFTPWQTSLHSFIYNCHEQAGIKTPADFSGECSTKTALPVHFIEAMDNNTAFQLVLETVKTLNAFAPVRDIHILSQTISGQLGATAFNKALHPLFSEGASSTTIPYVGNQSLHQGDRLTLRRKSAVSGWPQGDLGVVSGIDEKANDVTVALTSGEITVSFMALKNVALGWASVAHPSPVSRYPYVVLVLNDNERMADWRVLYRALSWTKHKLIVVGARKTFNAMIEDRPVIPQRPALDYISHLEAWKG